MATPGQRSVCCQPGTLGRRVAGLVSVLALPMLLMACAASVPQQHDVLPVALPVDAASESVGAVSAVEPQLQPIRDPNELTLDDATERAAVCQALRHDAAAQTEILRSPTVAAGVDDDGSTDISVGMDIADFRRAALIEESAEAHCRKAVSLAFVQLHLSTVSEKLTRAGLLAKSRGIDRREGQFVALQRKIDADLSRGNITTLEATSLMVEMRRIQGEGDKAASEAARREPYALETRGALHRAVQGLVDADHELEEIKSDLRTADAVSLVLKGGRRDDGATQEFDENLAVGTTGGDDVDYYGKATVSIRLGALSPRRFAHEEAARDARIRALGEPGGPIWRANVLAQAHRNALAGLVTARRRLESALERNRATIALLERRGARFTNALIGNRLQELRLVTDIEAVDASVSELEASSGEFALSQN